MNLIDTAIKNKKKKKEEQGVNASPNNKSTYSAGQLADFAIQKKTKDIKKNELLSSAELRKQTEAGYRNKVKGMTGSQITQYAENYKTSKVDEFKSKKAELQNVFDAQEKYLRDNDNYYRNLGEEFQIKSVDDYLKSLEMNNQELPDDEEIERLKTIENDEGKNLYDENFYNYLKEYGNSIKTRAELLQDAEKLGEERHNYYFDSDKYKETTKKYKDTIAKANDRLMEEIDDETRALIEYYDKGDSFGGGTEKPWIKRGINLLKEKGYSEDEAGYIYDRIISERDEREVKEGLTKGVTNKNTGAVEGTAQTLASVGANIAGSVVGNIEVAGQHIKNFFKNDIYKSPINYNTSMQQLAKVGQAVRSENTARIDDKYGTVGSFAYGVGTSMLDNVGSFILGGGAAESTGLLLANSSAQATLQEAKERGLDDSKALGTALAAGIFEYAFEKYSIGEILKRDVEGRTVKALLKNTLANFIEEGKEEIETDVANDLFDWVYNADMSRITTFVNNAKSNGATDKEAYTALAKDLAVQYAMDGLAGGIAGGIMGGIANYKTYKSILTADVARGTAIEKAGVNVEDAEKYIEKNNIKRDKVSRAEQQLSIDVDVIQEDIQNKVDQAEGYKAKTEVLTSIIEDNPDNELVKVIVRNVASNEMDKLERNYNADNRVQTFDDDGVINQLSQKNTLPRVIDNSKLGSNYSVSVRVNGIDTSITDVTIENGNPTFITNDGSAYTLEDDIQLLENSPQADLLVESIKEFGNSGIKSVLTNYDGSIPINEYIDATETMYRLGKMGFKSMDSAISKSKTSVFRDMLGNDLAEIMYLSGKADAQSEQSTPNPVGRNTQQDKNDGKYGVYTDTTDVTAALEDMYKMVSGAWGIDINRVSKPSKNGVIENGHFAPSTYKIMLNSEGANEGATLLHELAETVKAYNPKAYKDIRESLITYMVQKKGVKGVNALVKEYQKNYKGKYVGYQDMLDEIANDAIAGLFSTKDGAKQFIEHVDKNYKDPSRKRNIIEGIANFLQKMIDKFHAYMDSHKMTVAAETVMDMNIENATKIRQQFLDALDTAEMNYEDKAFQNIGKDVKVDGNVKYELKPDDELRDLIHKAATIELKWNGHYSLGIIPKIYHDIFDLTPLNLNMVPSHMYQNIVSKEDAINDGVYIDDKDVHYHNLGEKNLLKLIKKLEDPWAIYDNETEDGKHDDKLALLVRLNMHHGAVLQLYTKDTEAKKGEKLNHTTVTIFRFQKRNRYGEWVDIPAEEYCKDRKLLYTKEALNQTIRGTVMHTGPTSDSMLLGDNVAEFKQKINDYIEKHNIEIPKSEIKTYSDEVYSISSVDTDGNKLSDKQIEYFKDSKVRDKDGKLVVVYHGTGAEFTKFDKRKQGQNFYEAKGGFFFTESVDFAENYAYLKKMKGYLKINDPYMVDVPNNIEYSVSGSKAADYYDAHSEEILKKAKGNNSDGIIVNADDGNMYIAFESNQFKNADNLNPTENPDIRYSMSNIESAERNHDTVFSHGAMAYSKGKKYKGNMQSSAKYQKTYSHVVGLGGNIVPVNNYDGSVSNIKIPNKNERYYKDGKRKEIYNDLLRKSSIDVEKKIELLLDIENVIKHSKLLYRKSSTHSHGWLDANGWEYREIKGGDYVLNLGITEKEEKVLYDITKKEADRPVATPKKNGVKSTPRTASKKNINQKNSKINRKNLKVGKTNKNYSLSSSYDTAQSNNDYTEMQSLLNNEFDIIKDYKWTSKDFGAVAKELQTDMNSTYSQVEIRKRLNSLIKMVQAKGNIDEDVISFARNMVQNIMNQSKKQRDGSAQAILDDIKSSNIRLSDKQKKQMTDGYDDYRKSLFGKVRLVDTGTSLDQKWNEWSILYPGYFDSTTPDTQQPEELKRIISDLEHTYVYTDNMNLEEYKTYAAYGIFEKLLNLETVTQYAEIMEKIGGTFKNYRSDIINKQAQRLRDARSVYNDELKKAKIEARSKAEAEAKARYNAQRSRQKNAREKTEERRMIRKEIQKIHSTMEHPSTKKYIPARFASAIGNFIKAVDFGETYSQRRYEVRLDNLHRQLVNAQTETERAEIREKMALVEAQKTKYCQKLSELYEMYDKISKGQESTLNAAGKNTHADDVDIFSPELTDRIQRFVENAKDTSFYNMTLEQLKELKEIIRGMQFEISHYNNFYGWDYEKNGVKLDTTQMASLASIQMKKAKSGIVGKNVEKYFTNMSRASSFFNRLGGYHKGNVWSWVGEQIEQSQLDEIQYQMESAQFIKEITQDKKALKSMRNKKKLYNVTVPITTETETDTPLNKNVKMTKGMMISLYMHLLNDSNAKHIMGRGFIIPDMKLYYEGKISEAYGEKSIRVQGICNKLMSEKARIEYQIDEAKKEGKWEKSASLQEELEEVNEEFNNKINKFRNALYENFDEYDKLVISTLQKYWGEYSKEKLNEATMKRFGANFANVENYFPIEVDKDFISSEKKGQAQSGENVIAAMGSMQDRQIASSKRIVLRDVMDVYEKSMTSSAKYCAYLSTQANLNKMMSVYVNETENLNSIMKKEYAAARSYLDDLKMDLFGGKPRNDDLLGKLRGMTARAVLTMNVAVTMKQAASYPTAAAELGWSPLVKALVMIDKNGKKGFVLSRADHELIQKYSPLLYYRNLGNSTQELADMRDTSGAINKAYKIIDDKTNGYLLNWIQKVDVATVGRLWYASQYYVDENNKNLKKGTDKYYSEVAKVFNNVVLKTQPNYTVMQRNKFQRTNDNVMKSLMMFTTQTFQNANILIDAAGEYIAYKSDFKHKLNGVTRSDVKDKRTRLARAITSQLISAAILNGMTILANALLYKKYIGPEDEDGYIDDEDIVDYIIEKSLGSIASGFFGFGQIYSAVEAGLTNDYYNELSVNGIGVAVDALNEINTISKDIGSDKFDSDKFKEHFDECANIVLQGFGVPKKNATNIIKGLMNWKEELSDGDYDGTIGREYNRIGRYYHSGEKEALASELEKAKKKTALENPEYNNEEIEKKAKQTLRTKLNRYLKDDYLSGDKNKKNEVRKIMEESNLYNDIEKTIERWEK